MSPAPEPPGTDPLRDPERLGVLREAGLLDTLPEGSFDRLARLAGRLLNAPLAQVNLVDDSRQFSKSSIAPASWRAGRDTALEDSFCKYTIIRREPLVVEDARTHPLVRESAAVTEHGLVAYAGMPIVTPEGHALGTLCVGDFDSRRWTRAELEVLRDLADSVATEIELRREAQRHRRARDEATLSQGALSALLGHMPGMAYRCRNEPSWPMDVVSLGAEELTGYPSRDFMTGAIRFGDLIHPDDRERVWNAVQEAVVERRPFRVEYRLHRHDGVERWMWEQGEGVYSDAGELVALEGFVKDATDRRLAELELARNEATLRAIVGASPDVIEVLEPDGRFRWVSPAARQVLGYAADELRGVPMLDLVHPDDAAEVRAVLAAVAAGEQDEAQLRYRARHRADQWVFLDARGRKIHDHGDHGTVLVVRDVTREQALEERLRESEALYRQLFRTHPLPMWLIEPGTLAFLDANDAAVRHYGYSREEFLAMTVGDIHPPEELPLVVRAGSAVYGAGGFARHASVRHRTREGVLLDVEVHCQGIVEGGRTMHIAVAHDVTEERRAEAALRALKDEAERANRAKSEFLSRMSHELRTPMNAILGFAQLLELDVAKGENQESVEQILRAGRHLLRLIDEVLDLARIEADRLSLSVEPVLVQDVVSDSLQLVAGMGSQRRIAFSRRGDWNRYVRADQHRLKQVLLNLLSNAVKYNREGGSIVVACEERPGGRVRLSVSDTGPGIPGALLARLFTPFERLEAEGGAIQGTGLGLSLSRGLVHAMGGEIAVESTVGEGTTFWVELPGAESPLPDPPDGHRGGAVADTPRTVLYIEDNASNLRLMERILARRPDLKLVSAGDGRAGLEMALWLHPALILLDVHLPDMAGDQVLGALRSEDALREIPVIVISADVTPRQKERLVAAGAREYFAKPFEVPRVLAAIDDALAGAAGPASPPEA